MKLAMPSILAKLEAIPAMQVYSAVLSLSQLWWIFGWYRIAQPSFILQLMTCP